MHAVFLFVELSDEGTRLLLLFLNGACRGRELVSVSLVSRMRPTLNCFLCRGHFFRLILTRNFQRLNSFFADIVLGLAPRIFFSFERRSLRHDIFL